MASLRDLVPLSVKDGVATARHRLRWRRSPVANMTRRFVAQHGLVVQGGPFRGMRYPAALVGRAELVVPQLLGAYEEELHPFVEELVAGEPTLFVDVGTSDGYYAVGVARRLPRARVVGFEMQRFPARVCRELAAENGVASRVDVRGTATPGALAELPAPEGTIVLCDVEGAERELMDPARVPWLRHAELLVELHDFAAPGIEALVQERFADTHEVEVVRTRPRYVRDYPALEATAGTGYMDWSLGVAEFRPVPLAWARLRRRR